MTSALDNNMMQVTVLIGVVVLKVYIESDQKEIDDYKEKFLKACQYGRLVDVRELAAGKKIPLKNCIAKSAHGDTPLHVAAYFGHKNIVEYMIVEEDFDVEIKNNYENTPLHRAANQGHLNVVKYLVEEKKSDPMAVCRWRRTPLHNACKHGRFEVVKYLISDPRVDRSAKDSLHQQTPLQLAAEYGTVEVVQYMMENGHDEEEQGPYTLLHLAAYGGKLPTVKYLIQEREYDPIIKDKDEKTPLHSACVSGQLEVVEYLVDVYEVNVSSCDNIYKESPLGTAAKCGQIKIVKYLIEEKKCIIEHKNSNQNTAMHHAAWGGALEVMKYFIEERNCSPFCIGRKGRTPLHTASYNGKSDVVDYLIDHGVEVTDQDHDGATPLHLAARGGHLSLVKQLVRQYRCDHTCKDNSDKTPLDYADKHTLIIEYLSHVQKVTTDESRKNLEKELEKHCLMCRQGNKLGEGAYSVVLELKLENDPSVILAGKVFKTSSSSGKATNYHDKLTKEIDIMMKLEHNNIVAYKGVCFQADASLPVLVMERMMTSLHAYLMRPDNSGLPVKRKVSFLLDTASGLEYLHSHTPAIIHRDLTAKNVLLDSQLRAKIADFGNSRIMELHSNKSPGSMTTVPGTLEYMPPEAFGEHVKYNPRLDVFSFGHLSLFTVVQSPVCPLLGPSYHDDSTEKPQVRLEVERRKKFMRQAEELLPKGHILLDLVKLCLKNLPTDRPSATELVAQLKKIKTAVAGKPPEDLATGPQDVETTAAGTTEDDHKSHGQEVQNSFVQNSGNITRSKHSSMHLTSHGREPEGTDLDTSQKKIQSYSTVAEDRSSGVDLMTKEQDIAAPVCPVYPVIRGADVVAQTTVEITPDQPLDFHWEGHGFKVHIPAGAIRRERGRVRLCIQASLSGDYQLPDDGVLVSGVYWLSLHPHVERFDKKVTISLQHCASDDDSSISFVTAKCTQETLPYTFKPLLPGGSFDISREGTILVDHFSAVALSATSKSEYAVCTYYRPKQPNTTDIHITVTPNLDLQLQAVKREYKGLEIGPRTTLTTKDDNISLHIPPDLKFPETGWEKNGWELMPLTPVELEREKLDNYKEGIIPHFEFNLKVKDVRNPQSFEQRVYFTGTQTFITLSKYLVPETPQARIPGSDTRSAEHRPLEIINLIDVKRKILPVTQRWKHIGLALGLDPNELKKIERENRDNLEDCLTEALTLWLNKAYKYEIFGEPSWELLAGAVADPAGGNNPALAEEIAKK